MTINILDDIPQIQKIDTNNMLGSLELFGAQVEQVWQEAKKFKVPASYKKVRNAVVGGMGGSNLGTHILKALQIVDIPLELLNDYHVPHYVDKNTLFISSSYSGNTEEPLAAEIEARERGAKIIVTTSGGDMARWAKKNKIPAFNFGTQNNPCGQPRLGLGYMLAGMMAIFAKADLIKFSDASVKKILRMAAKYKALFGVSQPLQNNRAKQMALKLIGRSAFYIASEHLIGNAHAVANQTNETAKRFAGYFVIPELNHHLMEGMIHPRANTKNLVFVFLESELYDERVRKRFKVTQKVLDKNNIKHITYLCREKDRMAQVFEVLILGGYLTYYAGIMEGINPSDIPFVNYFKEELKK